MIGFTLIILKHNKRTTRTVREIAQYGRIYYCTFIVILHACYLRVCVCILAKQNKPAHKIITEIVWATRQGALDDARKALGTEFISIRLSACKKGLNHDDTLSALLPPPSTPTPPPPPLLPHKGSFLSYVHEYDNNDDYYPGVHGFFFDYTVKGHKIKSYVYKIISTRYIINAQRRVRVYISILCATALYICPQYYLLR